MRTDYSNLESIKQSLRGIVEPLFDALPEASRSDLSIPPIVLQNQRKRASERLLDALASRGTSELADGTQATVRQLARRWADRSFDDGFEAIRTFEIDCANEYSLNAAKQAGDIEAIRTEERNDYRRRIIRQFGRQEMRGIQAPERVMLPLGDIYVPLYLRVAVSAPSVLDATPENMLTFFVRHPVAEILKQHKKVLIIGGPGSGKTTLIAWLATQLASGQLANELDWDEDTIPLVITVRSLKRATLELGVLSQACGASSDTCQSALESGEAVLLVDGLDEAPPHVADRLLCELDRFGTRYPQIPIVVTSRPSTLLEGNPETLRSFQETSLDSLAENEIEEFVRKWCYAAEASLESDERLAGKAAEEASTDLIERIQKTRSVRELAKTPLLCTVLCVVHRFLGHRIPEHRTTLYEKCVEVLLYEWDAAKFRGLPEPNVGELDAKQKIRLLSPVARRMHEAHESEISSEQVIQVFDEVLPSLNVEVSAEEVVTNIKDRSGVLVEKADGVFAFSHLTLQEYFTAIDIVNSSDVASLPGRVGDGWWHEVIALAAGMDGVDVESLLKQLLKQEDDSAPFVAAMCLETARSVPISARREVEKALSRIPMESKEDFERLTRVGVVAAPLVLARMSSLERVDGVQASGFFDFFGSVDYDPGLPTFAELIGSPSSPFLVKYLAACLLIVSISRPAKLLLEKAIKRADTPIVHVLLDACIANMKNATLSLATQDKFAQVKDMLQVELERRG